MSRRSRRGFINTQEVLEKLSFGRAGAVQVMRSAKIGSPQYRTAMHLSEAVDDIAEKLTGDRTHLHDKPASTAPRENRGRTGDSSPENALTGSRMHRTKDGETQTL